MSIIIENQDLTQQYNWFINSIPGEFHLKGQCELPEIYIKHNSNSYVLEYPLSESTIMNLKKIAAPSPCGRGTETIYDTSIRNSFELNATQFNITNFNLSSTNNKYLESIRRCLLPDIDEIICEPYKLLIYGRNSFFKSHVDTPINITHFGSLIIYLPCAEQYEGGEFILCFNNENIKWKPINCEFMAFYSDIIHEIKPITNGDRIVITFNLSISPNIKDEQFEKAISDQKSHAQKWYKDRWYVSDYFYSIPTENIENIQNDDLNKLLLDVLSNCYHCKKLHIPVDILLLIVEFSNDSKVINSIQTILNDAQFHQSCEYLSHQSHQPHENGVLIVFEHTYHGKHINPLSLKGRDMYLYKTFKRYFGVYLTSITVCSVVGEWSDEYYDTLGGPQTNEWDEKDEKTEWKIRLEGELPHVLRNKIRYCSEFIVLYNNKQQSLVNAKFVNGSEEYYGNCGTYDLENQYRCTGLLLTKYDPKVMIMNTTAVRKENYLGYVSWFLLGLVCAIFIYYCAQLE